MPMSRSQKLILWYVVVLYVLLFIGFFPQESPLYWAPMAGLLSYWIMYLTGFFKREAMNEYAAMPQEETRAEAWKRQLEEGRRAAEADMMNTMAEAAEEQSEGRDVVIRLTNADTGDESVIIIHENGEIDTHGKPPADAVEQAKELAELMDDIGPEGVAAMVNMMINLNQELKDLEDK